MEIKESKMREKPIPMIYMDKNQVARLIGINPATLLKWSKSGMFPKPIVFGYKCFRWSKQEVEAHIAALSEK